LADLLDAQVELGRLAGAATASHAGFLHLPQQIHTAMQALGLDRQKLHSFPLIRLPQFASEILWARLDDIMNMNITQASSSEDLHTLRIQFKKLRYAAEFFIEGLPAQRIQPLVKLAQQYQKILGDLHDADVALDMFRAWHAVRHEKAPGESLQTASGEQTVYEKLQAGLGKLMLAARNDQTRLRAQFFSLWTVRHQRALTKLVQEAGLPLAAAKRGAPRGGVRAQARQKS
jgi:CHAD domain-containing protein